jgi:antitoxin ParD1/3/4
MEISLSPAQQEWLRARVARGEFATIEDAASAAITESMAGDIDDLAWARPYVDQARQDVSSGKVLTLEEHRARFHQPVAG